MRDSDAGYQTGTGRSDVKFNARAFGWFLLSSVASEVVIWASAVSDWAWKREQRALKGKPHWFEL